MKKLSHQFDKPKRSVASPEALEALRNNNAVRWYVLSLPDCHRGGVRGLQREQDRRIQAGEPSFGFFAPSYQEVKRIDGKFVNTQRPLLFNYVFVRASERDVFQLMQRFPVLSFLPRVRERKREYFPYLSDAAMENLQWVARSYSNTLPVYIPQPDGLRKGDRIRITEGRFKGVEATVVIQPGAGRKDVMVCVENWMWVPLLRVMPGEYEVIALNDEDKHVYTRLDNDCMLNGLHSALQRYHSAEGVSEEDRSLAARALKEYGNLQMDTDVMRCKLYAILLPAYTYWVWKKRRQSWLALCRRCFLSSRRSSRVHLLWLHFMVVRIAVFIIIWRMRRLIRGRKRKSRKRVSSS